MLLENCIPINTLYRESRWAPSPP